MESELQLLGIDIEHPSPSPSTWDGLALDCARCLRPVSEMLQERGVSGNPVLEQAHKACMAALLTQLWRDVRVDMIEHHRLYLLGDVAAKHGLDLPLMRKALSLDTERGGNGDLRDGSCDCALMPTAGLLALRKPYTATMRDLVIRTHELFQESQSPWHRLPPDINRQLHRLVLEGRATLRGIARHKYDTLTRRPSLGVFHRSLIEIRLRLSQ
jgi:hypothetical protein